MIFIKRDERLFPSKILKAAATAQAKLEKLPANERAEFIDKNSKVWKDFKKYLAAMSFDKCWYSEADDPQSNFDVDHFRPKNKAIRDVGVSDEGYAWLAFNWQNFRYSAERSNRLTTNEELEETEGKGNWFPLLPGSATASWDDRCEDSEQPVLLDPTSQHDVGLIEIDDDGQIGPSRFCTSVEVNRVKRSAELLGLRLPKLTGARRRVIRDIEGSYRTLLRMVDTDLSVPNELVRLRELTLPKSPYSRAARATLIRLGAANICASPEHG